MAKRSRLSNEFNIHPVNIWYRAGRGREERKGSGRERRTVGKEKRKRLRDRERFEEEEGADQRERNLRKGRER